MVGQHRRHRAHANSMQDGKVLMSGAPVEIILHARNIEAQGAVLCVVANYPSLAPAHELARIDWSKEQAAYKFVCKESSCLMKQDFLMEKPRANVTIEKCNAAEVMPTFSAPLPEKMTGMPSQRDCACVLGMPRRTLSQW